MYPGHIPFGPSVGSNGDLDGGAYGGDVSMSQFIFTDTNEFRKAVTAGNYETDVKTFTGGRALALQSIEPTLLRTIQEDKHFVFFNKLTATNAGSTVDEFTIKTAIGGYPGSTFNSEMGDIADTQGTYSRQVGLVKFLMTKREVSVVQQSQKTLVDTIAEEKVDAARELKTSVEWASFFGDSTVNPLEFDGLFAIINTTNDSDLIKDARGKGLSYVAQEVIDLAAAVAGQGRYGTITDVFCSLAVKAAEFDQKLDPAFRTGGGNQKVGTPVDGVKTSNGEVAINQDVFIQEAEMPFAARPAPFPAITTGSAAPVAPTIAGVAGANAASKFTSEHAGNYYWAVEAISKAGRSPLALSAQVVTASGDRVVVTVTHGADNANVATGFAIYRSRKNGTNAPADFRLVARVARAAGATTVYNDDNQNVPGTSPVFLVNMAPGAQAVQLRRLLPMTMFPLYPTSKASRPWAQLLFCYLRVAKTKHIAMVKNVLPGNASWKPF